MFEGAFSFRGRIGRLRYFLGNLVLMPIAFGVVVVVMVMMATAQRTAASLAFFALLGGLLVIAWLWYALSLQVRRIRDIGWDPLVVIGGVFAVLVFDNLAGAAVLPSLAIGHHGTAIGALLNLGFSLVLLFWPGGDGDSGAFYTPPVPTLERLALDSARFEPLAPAPAFAGPARMPSPRKTFGRRGLR